MNKINALIIEDSQQTHLYRFLKPFLQQHDIMSAISRNSVRKTLFTLLSFIISQSLFLTMITLSADYGRSLQTTNQFPLANHIVAAKL